jgi:hypothetical protein
MGPRPGCGRTYRRIYESFGEIPPIPGEKSGEYLKYPQKTVTRGVERGAGEAVLEDFLKNLGGGLDF